MKGFYFDVHDRRGRIAVPALLEELLAMEDV